MAAISPGNRPIYMRKTGDGESKERNKMTPEANDRRAKDTKDTKAKPPVHDGKDADDLTADFAKFTKDMYVRQLEVFNQWNDMLRKNAPTPEESSVMTNIVMDHVKKASDKFEDFMKQNARPGPQFIENQRRLMLDFIDNYNMMLKNIMATSQFTSMVGQALSRGMEARREFEKARDSMAGNMGLPTKSDIRELHESIHFLNKRLDEMERLLRKAVREE